MLKRITIGALLVALVVALVVVLVLPVTAGATYCWDKWINGQWVYYAGHWYWIAGHWVEYCAA